MANVIDMDRQPAEKDESIFYVIAALLCSGGLAYYGIEQWQQFDVGRINGVPAFIVGIAVIYMMRRQRTRHAALLVCWGTLILMLQDAWLVGGMYSVNWAMFPVALMFACWWLNDRSAITMTVVCLLAILAFHGLHHYGIVWAELPTLPTVSMRLIVIYISALALGIAIARHTRTEVHHLTVAFANLERLHLEQQQALFAAEQANSAKSIFLRNMSHELRTPLHAMLAFAHLGETLTRTQCFPEATKASRYFSRISDSGDRLQTLLDDVLTITHLQSGGLLTDRQSTSLALLIRYAVDSWQSKSQKQVSIDVVSTNDNINICCNSKMLIDVFLRLFDNAARYARQSPIKLQIDDLKTSETGPRRWVRCTVSDHGPGIPPSEWERVFDTFTESTETASQAGGRGLGLAICAGIIHAHGGEIRADEGSGGGCAIIFTLPTDDM